MAGKDAQDMLLRRSEVRSAYLITYSQANLEKFPNRSNFCQNGGAKVIHWCCSRENHVAGGQHYHIAVKLNRTQRWQMSKVSRAELWRCGELLKRSP